MPNKNTCKVRTHCSVLLVLLLQLNGCSLSVEPCEASLIGVVFEGKRHVSHSGKLSAVTRTIPRIYVLHTSKISKYTFTYYKKSLNWLPFGVSETLFRLFGCYRAEPFLKRFWSATVFKRRNNLGAFHILN